MIPNGSVASPPAANPVELRVRTELLRTAYTDSIYGAFFSAFGAALVGGAMLTGFPASTVITWVLLMWASNALRLILRWRFMRQPAIVDSLERWERGLVLVSALNGLCVGWGMSTFYGTEPSIYREIIVLVVASLTTGASRILAPVYWANLSYLYLAIVPLLARFVAGGNLRSGTMILLGLIYLGYMTVAARQQLRTLRRLVSAGDEKAALIESLRTAKAATDDANRELTAEVERRKVVERELREAHERAEAANRSKGEFLATMSHEIRTPLGGLLGLLRVARDNPLDPAQQEHLATASRSADAMLELINDILDLSKLEAGRMEFEKIAFDPTAAVQTVIDLMRPQAEAKGLALAVDLDPALPALLLGDPTRLRQVLFNLVANAVKFTERGRVAVVVKCGARDQDSIVLDFAVTDTGIGMDAATAQRLFTVFMQADSSISRRFGGSGLGLAISQGLVESMGGRIEVASKPDQGSTFHFGLRFGRPTSGANREPLPESEAPYVPPALRGRVLVVEDERINQRVIGHFLRQMGLDATFVEDGLKAVEAATSAPWDVVLMDLRLPGIDGVEATRRIRAHPGLGRLPIFALTANAGTSDRAACLAAGMDDFFTKPIRREALAAALAQRLPAAVADRASDHA